MSILDEFAVHFSRGGATAHPAFFGHNVGVALWVLLGLTAALVAGGALRHISSSLGVTPGGILLVLILSLIGSSINLPIARLAGAAVPGREIVAYGGMEYLVPILRRGPGMILAVNVGGAVIPVLVSMHLLFRQRELGRTIAAIGLMALIVHYLARIVPGMGIALPTWQPPVCAAAIALLFSRREAGSIAYVAGSLGTLIGADLMNLGRIRTLGTGVASIGGAGQSDAIFLTGLIAVILAGWWGGRTVAAPRAAGWAGAPSAPTRGWAGTTH